MTAPEGASALIRAVRFDEMDDADRFLNDVCPFCGSAQHRTWITARDQLYDRGSRRFHGLACTDCGGRFTQGSDFADLDEFYGISYPSSYYGGASGGREHDPGSNPFIRDVLRRHTAPGGARVLDVGCGSGGFMDYLRRGGYDVEGIEIDAEASEYCRRFYGIPVFTGPLEAFDPAGRSFDAVTMVGVIEHLLNPIRTMRRTRKLIGTEGRIIFDFPDVGSLESRLAGPRWWALDLPRHTLHFTPRTARTVVDAAGLRVLEVVRIAKTWFHYGFLRPPVHDGIPRASLPGLAIKGVASLFLLARLRPHVIFICAWQ